MLFVGEEVGLIGSYYYVKYLFFLLDKIVFLINIDIMGSGEEGIMVVNVIEFLKQFGELDVINVMDSLLVKIGKCGKVVNFDYYFFIEVGVLVFFIYIMGFNKNYYDIYDMYENLFFVEFDDLMKLLIWFGEIMMK